MKHVNTLRIHRTARGLTQFDVAKRVDIHIDRYGRVEKGVTPATYAEAVRLAGLFGVEPSVLFPVTEAAVA